ncbi:MAG: apolipoprotein N-acyltransferase [Treponema sp.]|nr:apolipoprotein N-acyltransferase [Treponema sp.]
MKRILFNLGLLALAVLLFAASFPNLLFAHGAPFLAWIAFVPVFLLLYRVSLPASILWGALYGFAAYGLFNYWLTAFHPLAGLIVNSIYLVYAAALFFFLRLAVTLFPRRAYLIQALIWLAYEYLRTLGFLGYSYGISGYSQWKMIPLIQIAGIFGVWGVSALVVFPSAWLATALNLPGKANTSHGGTEAQREGGKDRSSGNGSASELHPESSKNDPYSPLPTPHSLSTPLSPLSPPSVPPCLRERFLGIPGKLLAFFMAEKISAIAWAAALIAALCYGFAVPDFSSQRQVNIALVQHNTDPWLPSKAPTIAQANEEYRKDLAILRRLSDEALAAEPKPDMVVWSETAFVPRIYWHETYRDDQFSWSLVKELLDYMAAQDVPFVIGNDDARKDPAKNPNSRENHRVDYNAALLYEKGKLAGMYRKLHLVPFTEHFPYKKRFPAIHRALADADTHFWEKGTEATVFRGPGFSFSTPICFEDTFGYLSRKFVQNGAEVIVNLSNDAWSGSLPAQNQHLAMAVFRAVENRRSLVRATASGQTCGIGPSGKIIASAKPFSEAWLTVAIPVITDHTTAYTRHGDWLGAVFAAAAAIMLIFGLSACILRKTTQRRRV